LEVITEFSPMFYSIFFGLAIICAGIISVIIFKKIQDYKQYQEYKKHELLVLVGKFENALMRIKRQVEIYQNDDEYCKDLVVMGISGIVDHQLGHIPRFRSYLK